MVNHAYIVRIFELYIQFIKLFCNYDKHYYIGHKQGIKLKNGLSYMENDF